MHYVYHPEKPPQIVTPEEYPIFLSDGWYDSPAKFAKGLAAPVAAEPVEAEFVKAIALESIIEKAVNEAPALEKIELIDVPSDQREPVARNKGGRPRKSVQVSI